MTYIVLLIIEDLCAMLKHSCDMELRNLLGEMFFYTYCQRLQIAVVFFNGSLLSDTINGLFCSVAEPLRSK